MHLELSRCPLCNKDVQKPLISLTSGSVTAFLNGCSPSCTRMYVELKCYKWHRRILILLFSKQLQNLIRTLNKMKAQSNHMGCWKVGGNFGIDTGVQLYDRMTLSARRKLRNRLATSRSWRKSFWKSSETKMLRLAGKTT